METILDCRYDARQSFYGKAKVRQEGDKLILISYITQVAYIEKLGGGNFNVVVLGTWSNTTTRHIKEFLKQNGFKAETSKQILEDYGVKNGN